MAKTREAKETEDLSIRVALIDDHPVVRAGLRLLINSEADMEVVAEGSDGTFACRIAKEEKPDVMIMDISMPTLKGPDATALVRAECPSVRVLALTVHEERAYVKKLLAAGASGYVLKRSVTSELVRAVRTVAAGGTYIDPNIASKVVEGYLGEESPDEVPADDLLSEREREVLIQVARGFSNKEIAAVVDLSVKTVETYKARAAEKLGLKSRVDIVRYASRKGWLSVDAGD